MAWWLFVIVSIASIPLAGEMARERNRPSRRWLWIAIAVGPLAPLALLVLGGRHPAAAN
jgi:ABC-type iron transport system FetAB permease component